MPSTQEERKFFNGVRCLLFGLTTIALICGSVIIKEVHETDPCMEGNFRFQGYLFSSTCSNSHILSAVSRRELGGSSPGYKLSWNNACNWWIAPFYRVIPSCAKVSSFSRLSLPYRIM
ncbi:uncharacterized protein LOC114526182 [Dendronephthya gigantea]|uniref:uncharacterized protein LOC114526182 n=1 Tax=Dendronephthya gigantea TaxID=151771 RepID=UPI00106A50E4|nr:uncharacterized protein LOC114526182 [Dendronephthya gigantea]